MTRSAAFAVLLALSASCASARAIVSPDAPFDVEKVERSSAHRALPTQLHGRGERTSDAAGRVIFKRQWPGSYVEAAFVGTRVYLDIGDGDVHLKLSVDGESTKRLKPPAGRYAIFGLSPGRHDVRVDVISEHQDAPTTLGIFYVDEGSAAAPPKRATQIEFVGDSYTVGYANTSSKRKCTDDEIWRTTDTSLGIVGQLATILDADYRVHAISGRGVIRNYAGRSATTITEALDLELLDGPTLADDDWSPSLFVVGLGSNDFSTPLQSGEKWKTRGALVEDFVATYKSIIASLRARAPDAYIVIWSGLGLIEEQTRYSRRVVDELRAAGDERIGFVTVPKLGVIACNWHPTVDDATKIVAAIVTHLEQHR